VDNCPLTKIREVPGAGWAGRACGNAYSAIQGGLPHFATTDGFYRRNQTPKSSTFAYLW
jgi:hypothetical protein